VILIGLLALGLRLVQRRRRKGASDPA
jgi:hypothetical protein